MENDVLENEIDVHKHTRITQCTRWRVRWTNIVKEDNKKNNATTVLAKNQEQQPTILTMLAKPSLNSFT